VSAETYEKKGMVWTCNCNGRKMITVSSIRDKSKWGKTNRRPRGKLTDLVKRA